MMVQEERLRLAAGYVQLAKYVISPDWDNYEDIQRVMSDLETARLKLERLLSKTIKGELK